MKVRSRSGSGQVKKVQIFKLIFLHIKGVYPMQLITGNPMVVLVLLHVVNNGKNSFNV